MSDNKKLIDDARRSVDMLRNAPFFEMPRDSIAGGIVGLADALEVAADLIDSSIERAEQAEAKLAAVRADMHLTMMTPDPNDPGAYVPGRDAETALTEGEQEEGTRWMPTR